MKIYLHNRGNIDHGQNPHQPLYNTKSDVFYTVEDFNEARNLHREYIIDHCLDPCNYPGCYVVNDKGNLVGFIEYNGKLHINGEQFNTANKDYKKLMEIEWNKELTKMN